MDDQKSEVGNQSSSSGRKVGDIWNVVAFMMFVLGCVAILFVFMHTLFTSPDSLLTAKGALSFCVCFTALTHVFVFARQPKSFWNVATYFSCILAAVGLMGLTEKSRKFVAEVRMKAAEETLAESYGDAAELANRFAKIYQDVDIDRVQTDDVGRARDAAVFFSRAVSILEKDYESGEWKRLLEENPDRNSAITGDTARDTNYETIRYTDGGVSLLTAQKEWMLNQLRIVAEKEQRIAEMEASKQSSDWETWLVIVWPYLVAASIAIQFTKASADWYGYEKQTSPTNRTNTN